MLENEFERKVQQRMDELRLRPSDAVWEHVEKELRRKKKRRVVVFFSLLAGLSLLGFSGYYFIYPKNQKLVDHTSTLPAVEQNNENLNATTLPLDDGQLNDKLKAKQQKAVGPKVEDISKNSSVTGNETTALKQGESSKSVTQNNVNRKSAFNENKNSVNSTRTRYNSSRPDRADQPPSKRQTALLPERKSKNVNDHLPTDSRNLEPKEVTRVDDNENFRQETGITKDQSEKSLVIATGVDSQKENMDSIRTNADKQLADEKEENPQKQTAGKGKKLKWGFDLAFGTSDIGKGALPFSSQKSMMDASFSYSSPLPITPNYAFYMPPMPPSALNPGLAFKFGPTAELQISRRSSVSFGFNYAYMSTRMKIGTFTDTSLVVNNLASVNRQVSAVYRGYRNENYTNRFQFLQVPVSYQLRLNKGIKTPILWNIGASAGYLVETNAVLYDTTAGGIYYKDNNAFNKFQLNLHTGVAIRFGTKRKVQWSIGPEISMGTNKLVKDAYNKKQYLVYGGLTGRLIFSKKK